MLQRRSIRTYFFQNLPGFSTEPDSIVGSKSYFFSETHLVAQKTDAVFSNLGTVRVTRSILATLLSVIGLPRTLFLRKFPGRFCGIRQCSR
ncbi:hypothetical protein ACFX19_029655 [Malus domestica]